MTHRFFLTLLCSTLIAPMIAQTASAATTGCDPAIVRRALHHATALQEEKSQLYDLTNLVLRALFSRGQNAGEDLEKVLQRAEAGASDQEALCMRGNVQSCMTALRLEQYIESLRETIGYLRTNLTRAMNHLITRTDHISEEITSELDRTTAFVRECSSNRR